MEDVDRGKEALSIDGEYLNTESRRIELESPVRDFFDKHMGAMAVVSAKNHTIFYYTDSLCSLLKPSGNYESGMTFGDFFFDGKEEAEVVFDHADMGPYFFYSKSAERELEVTTVSTQWGEEAAYMVYFHDHEKSGNARIKELYNKRSDFANFIHGEENGKAFNEFGYKGYTLWNISLGRLVHATESDYAIRRLGDDADYNQYYQIYLNHLELDGDRENFEALSSENVRKTFFEGKAISENVFRMDANMDGICLKVIPSMMISPESGEFYLKLQTENVTDDVLFETMLHTAAFEATDFVAYINGRADYAYYIRNDRSSPDSDKHCKGRLSDLLTLFSSNLGYSFTTVQQVFEFIETKCEEDENSDVTFNNKSSDSRVVSIHLKVIDKKRRQYFMSCKDVSEIVNMETISYYDDLTGLPNMTHFRNIALTERENMKSKGVLPAFVYFDLRDMKAVNENYGFAKGNGILIGTSYVLRSVFKGDPVSRFSDDHFVVLTDRKLLEQRLEKVHDQVLNNPSGIPIQICSGIYIDDGRQKLDILAACDRARLACKSLKGDYQHKYKIFDRAMFDDYHQRQHVLTHFNEALEKGWIKVYYQPIIRTVTGNICDMEALSRWVDPERGMLSPGQFIPCLEDHRLISKLDFYMVRKICENLREQKKSKLPIVPVSVNLSRVDFEECDVVDEILNIVDSYQISHKLLTIEITESALTNNQQFLTRQIDRFRKAGFNVWMDDFGSEYSSLNTLQEYDFDLIKLDMKFMKNFSLTGRNHAIISDIVSMVSRLGIHTLAEGVQTEEQLKFLRDIGCEKAQGYLFSRPMPCEYFIEKAPKDTGLDFDEFYRSTYYDKIGAINFKDSILMEVNSISGNLNGVPAAVMEYRDEKFKLLKANDAYKNFLKLVGLCSAGVPDNMVTLECQPSPRFTEAVKCCFASGRWESIIDDTEGGISVSSRLMSIAYDTHSGVGAVLVVVNRTYHKDDEKSVTENEYHLNTNLLLMAGKGLASMLGYRSIYDFLSDSCYFHVNLTRNMLEELHLSNDDLARIGSENFRSYDEFVQAEFDSQPPASVTAEQTEYFDRKNLIQHFIDGKNSLDLEFGRLYNNDYRRKHITCRMSQIDSQIHAWFFVYNLNS